MLFANLIAGIKLLAKLLTMTAQGRDLITKAYGHCVTKRPKSLSLGYDNIAYRYQLL